MIIRVSFLVVASVAAVTVSQMKTNSPAKKNSKIRSPGSDGSHSQHEFGDKENRTATTLVLSEEEQAESELQQDLPREDFKKLKLKTSDEKQDEVTDMELIQKLGKYKQRQAILERKLLELNGLKEEQSAIAHLRTLLYERTIELDLLSTTIASLQAEIKILHEKKEEGVLAEKQLDMAKNMINEMQRKKDVNARPVKEQILKLQQQVTEFQKYDSYRSNDTVNKMLEAAKNLELEVLELKRRNKELELEKREVGTKLATVQLLQVQMAANIREEITGLRHVNKDLYDQVEMLQKNRFDMVQELVYQRWLYTCLRFEVHNHQKQSSKASLDYCSQNSVKELYKKTDALPSDTEVDSISSNATLDESDEIDTTTLESSSSSQSSSSKDSSLLRRIKRWKKSKDDSNPISSENRSYRGNYLSSRSLIRRFSMSMVRDDLSMPKNSDDSSFINVHQKTKIQDSSKPLETPIFPRLKRVSFGDSVKPSIYYYMPEADEDEIYENETSTDSSGQSMEVTSPIISCNKHKAEKYRGQAILMDMQGRPTNNDTIAENKGSKSKIGHSDELHSSNENVFTKDENVKTQVLQLVAFFFFLFLFIVLAYFLNK